MKRITWAGWVCLAGIVALVLIAAFAPWLAPHDPTETDPMRRLAPPYDWATLFGRAGDGTNASESVPVRLTQGKPVPGFPLGCDQSGQCLLSRLIYGTRLSLLIGFLARSVALLIGVTVGLAAGYYGGWIDWLLMRVVDIFLAFPSLLLAIAISMAIGQGVTTVILAIGLIGWAETARIIRGLTLELRSVEFILAARAMGAGDVRIMLRHILPNCLPLIVVVFTMGMATAILSEASLSFLGLGVDPQIPTWGGMVSMGKDYLLRFPGLSLYPGACIAFIVILFNVLGDELRDVFDPGRKEQWGS